MLISQNARNEKSRFLHKLIKFDQRINKKVVSLMGTYNNPGMLRSLFSLPPSLPYKFHKSIFPYRGRNSMNWKSRFNFNIRAKECKFRWWKESRVIPVSDLVAGEGKNLRSHFSIFQRSKTVPAIVRYPADEYSTVARRIKFSERTKSVPRGLVRKILFWQCFRGDTRVTLFDRRLETKRAALWKDISMILHESSMFYKSKCVFALWRLESANWCRYYLSRWCWS